MAVESGLSRITCDKCSTSEMFRVGSADVRTTASDFGWQCNTIETEEGGKAYRDLCWQCA